MPSDRTRGRRRLQFSVLSLLVLMTASCLLLGWWVWPKVVRVVALVHAPPGQISLGEPGSPSEFFDFQEELLAALNNPALLVDTAAIVGNGNLGMLRGRNDPAKWLRERLKIEVGPSGVVSVQLDAPERFASDAVECVDYIVLRAATRVNVKATRKATKAKQSLGSLADSPRILQAATVVE